ncbi:hypothetical protein O3S68_12025 [Kosakonia sp. SOY2]|uniref:hypothetical protein n=1 Tax=Kosakonia sp. SOY2 TaxID=3014557 RepID=UPI0022ABEF1A|nr:hypothetical protein [Kosakonia sp. SOY2]MCZ3383015.1 hypothetical protein [Kosakonia sp. SOY2]
MKATRAHLSWFIALGALCNASASAQQDSTMAALELADKTEFTAVENKALSALLEIAGSLNENSAKEQRVSLDMRWDKNLLRNWRVVLSNRFDSRFSSHLRQNRNINTLREAWLSHALTSQASVDVGRINTRYGVALGYNPTDFLGRGTVRSAISADPESLRSNRLGNAMIRLQKFWDKAAATVIWSPKISASRRQNSASLDWNASNPRERVLLAGSYRFAENLNPQLLLLQEEHRSAQLGVNLSRVLSRSALVYAEWAGGRQPFNWQEALSESQWDTAWRNRAAVGLTWTGENHLTLRLEGHYNGSADSKKAISALRAAPPYIAAQSAAAPADSTAQLAQDGLTPRCGALFQAYWKDIADQYDFNLIWQRDLQRQKNMGFVELRRHLNSVDIALQWQKIYRAEVKKTYSVQPDRRWQLSVDYYF